jgi:hypothetical protein
MVLGGPGFAGTVRTHDFSATARWTAACAASPPAAARNSPPGDASASRGGLARRSCAGLRAAVRNDVLSVIWGATPQACRGGRAPAIRVPLFAGGAECDMHGPPPIMWHTSPPRLPPEDMEMRSHFFLCTSSLAAKWRIPAARQDKTTAVCRALCAMQATRAQKLCCTTSFCTVCA